jgi:hypothetical protein
MTQSHPRNNRIAQFRGSQFSSFLQGLAAVDDLHGRNWKLLLRRRLDILIDSVFEELNKE